MSNRKTYQSLENLGKALNRLKDALNETHLNSLYIDGTIQRFERLNEGERDAFKRINKTITPNC